MYIREDQADIRVSLDTTGLGTTFVAKGDSWFSAEGGVLEADDAKTRPGGMGREVSAGGPASRVDLTLTTQFTDTVAVMHGDFELGVGNARVKVGVSWLGPNRIPTGHGMTLQGTLKRAATPTMGGGAGVGMYTIVVSCDELAVNFTP